MNMMWRSGTFASESMVMADTRAEWLVYIWESFAPTDIVFIISPKLLTPSGLFSHQTAFSVFTLCFGCWKNAEHDGFNFDAKTFRPWQMHHHLLQYCKALFLALLSTYCFHHRDGFLWLPRGSITAYSRPLASRVNLKLSPSLPRLHQ